MNVTSALVIAFVPALMLRQSPTIGALHTAARATGEELLGFTREDDLDRLGGAFTLGGETGCAV